MILLRLSCDPGKGDLHPVYQPGSTPDCMFNLHAVIVVIGTLCVQKKQLDRILSDTQSCQIMGRVITLNLKLSGCLGCTGGGNKI